VLPLSQPQKVSMNGAVSRELRMKSSRQNLTLLHESRFSSVLGKYFDTWPDALDDGGPDKDHFQWFGLESGSSAHDVAGDLPTIAIAKNGYVQKAERSLFGMLDVSRQQDGASTRAKHSVASAGKLFHGVKQPFFLHELELCGAFTARQNQAIATVQIPHRAYFDRRGVQAL